MSPDGSPDEAASVRARLLTLLGAIASGVGVVGFVAVVGGMVVWIRFESLHLPADTVVAAIPRTQLIVIGASTLIPFIGLGLLAVLLAYLFAADNLVPSRPWRDVRSAWSGDEEPISLPPESPTLAAASSAAPATERTLIQKALILLTKQAAALVENVAPAAEFGRVNVVSQSQRQRGRLVRRLQRFQSTVATLPVPDREALAGQLLRTQAALEEVRKELKKAKAFARKRRKGVLITWVVSVLVLAVIEILIVLFIVGAPSPAEDVLLGGLGLVLAAGTLVIGVRTQGFAIFGATIFSSILLFGTANTLLRVDHIPKVQPTAVLRKGHDVGVTGFFVAETSDRIYLIRVTKATHKGSGFDNAFTRLVVIPRSDVVSMEIGPFQEQKQAYGTSYKELLELCGIKVAENPAPAKSGRVRCGHPGLAASTGSGKPGKGSKKSTRRTRRIRKASR